MTKLARGVQVTSSVVLTLCSIIVATWLVWPDLFDSLRAAPELVRGPDDDSGLPSWTLLGAGRLVLGNPNATHTLVVFTDYSCEYCRAYSPILREAIDSLGDSLRVVVRAFPLRLLNPSAVVAAIAAYCAADQGAFGALDSLLSRPSLDIEKVNWRGLAQLANVKKPAVFADCVDNDSTAALVAEDIRIGRQIGVRALPMVLMDERRLPAAPGTTAIIARVRNSPRIASGVLESN